MYDFAYHAPQSLGDVSTLLSGADDPKIVAGGMTLIPTLKQRLAQPSDVIDLGRIAELRGIRRDGDWLVIGAMTPHAVVAASDVVQKDIPALASLAGNIGDPAVRSRGTIGGSIANNDPSADYPGAVLALDAVVVTDSREISGADFFTGMFETALEPNEIITAVRFPIPAKAAYAKFRNPASRYAVVGVFVAQTAAGVRVAVTGAAATVFRHDAMEEALTGNFSPAALDGIATPADELNSDIHATAAYRANLVGVMAKRAVAACL